MAPSRTGTGRFLAKALGIKLQEQNPFQDEVARGDSVLSLQTTGAFVEEEPRTSQFLLGLLPSGPRAVDYICSLFPFVHWIGRYNLQWFAGDLVAGITVGAVVVPQGMAYAALANLPPQFGLYSSFMGVLLYWIFATSKDITIGPVAVLSTVTGSVVADMKDVLPHVPAHFIASALSVLAGAVVFLAGLLRLGWIVDLIPLTALSAFMTGSAIGIVIGQIPTLMGITGISSRDATYQVLINTLKALPRSRLDAAMGLSALATLYIIRSSCKFLAKRYPAHQHPIFFISTLRTVFVILLYTMISWLVNRNLSEHDVKFKILLTVPRGFQHAAVPELTMDMVKNITSYLPAAVIVLLIEHIAVAKSFGRVNNYTIDPSQEMVAIGATNLLGPFLGAYPATGSFSRSAINSKAGARTPFVGGVTASVVLLAIYALPAMFYYVPSASLSGVIIHAVGDLITPPDTVYRFWRVSPLEVGIFFIGVIVTVFSTIENGVYCTICISAAMLIYRILKARGQFLGKVKVHSVLGDHVIGDDYGRRYGEFGTFASADAPARNVFLPVNHNDGSNPEVQIDNPYPGVFIYRFSEGLSYPNASHSLEYLTGYVFTNTRRTNLFTYDRPGDRPWNDAGPSGRKKRKAAKAGAVPDTSADLPPEEKKDLPTLKAIILDFSSVNHVDITSVQQLIDVRNQLDLYASPDPVDWHIACINNRWTKRALVSAGFGYPAERGDGLSHRWRSIFSVAEIGGSDSAARRAEAEVNERLESNQDVEKQVKKAETEKADNENVDTEKPGAENIEAEASSIGGNSDSGSSDSRADADGNGAPLRRTITVHGLNRPLFHVDLTSALQSAVANVEARAEVRVGDSTSTVLEK